MEKQLDNFINAIWEKENTKYSLYDPIGITNQCLSEFKEEPEDSHFKKTALLLIMLKNILISCGKEKVTAAKIIHFFELDFENNNENNIFPSKINTEYDHKLFTASCAAMTGLLANPSVFISPKELVSDSVIAAKSLIDALNKE